MERCYTAYLDFPFAWGMLERCPACGGTVVAVAAGGEAEFRCDACGAIWRDALGRVARVAAQAHGEHADVEDRGQSVGGA